MDSCFDEWENSSPLWQTELGKRLALQNDPDVWTEYRVTALAFPSRTHHPSTFDYPMIDWAALHAWADDHGWLVAPAPEMGREQDSMNPPIRFTKKN